MSYCPQTGVLSVCQQARTLFSELAPVWQRIYAIIAEENVEKSANDGAHARAPKDRRGHFHRSFLTAFCYRGACCVAVLSGIALIGAS